VAQRWSDRLAQLAQEWADRCAWGHRPPNSYNPKDYGFPSVGENIWAWSKAGIHKIPDKPIQDWFDEKQYYVYDTKQCRKEPCGHYTTVSSSTHRTSSLQNVDLEFEFYIFYFHIISYHIINIFVKRHRQSYRGAEISEHLQSSFPDVYSIVFAARCYA